MSSANRSYPGLRNASNMESSNSSTLQLDTHLIASLNNLLAALHLPITLESPLDLIPSLLLAILESILEQRLPITTAVRESRSPADKVQAMKVFLGVLETDVLEMDVGLSDVDPRKLAAGERDEVVFAGELLCWLGKQRGFLPPETVETLRDVEDSSVLPTMRGRSAGGARSPSTRSTVTNSALTNLSMESVSVHSDTTIMTASFSSERSASVVSTSTIAPAPRCIHELEGLSMALSDGASGISFGDGSGDITAQSESFCNCHANASASAPQTTPVRYSGWIDTIDDTRELQSFEASRRMQNQSSASQSRSKSNVLDSTYLDFPDSITKRTPSIGRTRIVTRHTSPSQHKLALLNERARLLTELANLKTDP